MYYEAEKEKGESKKGIILGVFLFVCMLLLHFLGCLLKSYVIFVFLAISAIGVTLSIDDMSINKRRAGIIGVIINVALFTLLVVIMFTLPLNSGSNGACMVNSWVERLKIWVQPLKEFLESG